jgi:histidine ammonia-lyase
MMSALAVTAKIRTILIPCSAAQATERVSGGNHLSQLFLITTPLTHERAKGARLRYDDDTTTKIDFGDVCVAVRTQKRHARSKIVTMEEEIRLRDPCMHTCA